MRVPQKDSNPETPDTPFQKEVDGVLGLFAQRQRQSRPLRSVRAWDSLRESLQIVSAEEVHRAWRSFKKAQQAAIEGGPTEGLLELHDTFTRRLEQWLAGPCC